MHWDKFCGDYMIDNLIDSRIDEICHVASLESSDFVDNLDITLKTETLS